MARGEPLLLSGLSRILAVNAAIDVDTAVDRALLAKGMASSLVTGRPLGCHSMHASCCSRECHGVAPEHAVPMQRHR